MRDATRTTRRTRSILPYRRATRAWMGALSADERRDLHRTNAFRSWLSFATNWALVAAAFALVAWTPNPLTIVLAIFVIGARQLGCAILMHEAAHRSLFRSRALNDWAGNWLAAYPVWLDVDPYRALPPEASPTHVDASSTPTSGSRWRSRSRRAASPAKCGET